MLVIRIVALWVLLVSFAPVPALAAPPAPHAFGEVVRSHGLAIQVVRWVYPTIEPDIRLATGQQAIAVDVLVASPGNTTLPDPFQFLTLRDASNRRYNPELFKFHLRGDKPRALYLPLNAGEQARRWMIFLPAPGEPGPFTLAFNAGLMFGLYDHGQPEEWLFDLGSQPASVTPSPDILRPVASVHQTGELIQSGGLAVAVLGWTPVRSESTGAQLARVEVLIANQGPTAREVNTPSLTDANGKALSFSLPPEMDGRDPVVRAAIVPGERVRALLDFTAPTIGSTLTFGFQHHCRPAADGCESDGVLVTLPAQPGTVPPPAGFPTDQISLHAMNEPVRAGDLLLTVTGARLTDQGFVGPQPEGKTYLAADVTFQNTGAALLKWTLADQMRVKDAQDRYYVPGWWAVQSYPDEQFGTEIGPGQTVKGRLGFQLAQDSSKLVLVFQTVDAQDNPAKVDVALAPTSTVAAKPLAPSVVTPAP
jgi:hypothetical protein